MQEFWFTASLIALLPLPALILVLCHRYSFLNRLGSAALCFLSGVAYGQLMELGFQSTAFRPLAEQGLGVLIAFALPMVLFSSDVKSWFTLARRTMISMIIAMATVVCLATLLGTLMNKHIHELPYIASMAVGNFTGSLVNGAALKIGLQASHESFLLVYGYDVLISSLYLLCLITIAHPLAKKVLPPFSSPTLNTAAGTTNEFDEFKHLTQKNLWKDWPLPLVANLIIIAIALLMSSQAGEHAETTVAVILITVLSLLASFFRRIRQSKITYPLGMYLILLFCLFSGALFHKGILEQVTLTLLVFFLLLAFGAIFLHLMICRWLRIDADTFLVTSVAAILSPPFVPLAVNVMRNRAILLSGMSAGVLGYACGNTLGLIAYWLIEQLT